MVGVTAFKYNLADAFAVARTVQKVVPKALRVIGGWEASPQAEDVLAASNFDVVVRNEGEETLVELATLVRDAGANEARAHFGEVEGLTFRDSSGAIVETPTHLPKIDLDDYPLLHEGFEAFVYDNYPEERMSGRDVAYITGSRGCIFSCIYCANPAIYTRKIRYRSPENVLAEIRTLYAMGYRTFSFRDEIFTSNPRRTRELVAGIKALQAEGIFIHWICQTRADLLDEQIILQMKDAGLGQLMFGVESGDQEFVNFLKASRVNLDRVGENTRIATEAGIVANHYYLFGAPGQTWQSMFQNYLFLRRNVPSIISSATVEAYAGTKIFGFVPSVMPTEANFARDLFDNLFFKDLFVGGNPSKKAGRDAERSVVVRRVFGNMFRYGVMVDLFIRSMPGYSDVNRWIHFLQLAKDSEDQGENYFLNQYFRYLNASYAREIPEVHAAANANGYKETTTKCVVEEFTFAMGVHPSIAEAYFDDFLANISLANGYRTLMEFGRENFVKFFLLNSAMWGVVRMQGFVPPSTIEFVEDAPENGRRLEAAIEQFKPSSFGRQFNAAFGETGVGDAFQVFYRGLLISVDVGHQKITLSIIDTVPQGAVEIS